MITAVIFDMDGLMIDSEPIHYEAYATVLKKLGKIYPLEENNRLYIGLSDRDQAKDIVKRNGLPLTPEQLVEKKQKMYKTLIGTAIVPQPGLMKLLKDLKDNNYKTAIASSSSRKDIAHIIRSLKISSFIDDYCSAEEVRHGKPAPDIFLLAAKKLHVAPNSCLILEDAPIGIEAAANAGMKSIAIPSNQTKNKDFSKATKKLKSLEEVFKYLENIISI